MKTRHIINSFGLFISKLYNSFYDVKIGTEMASCTPFQYQGSHDEVEHQR